MSEAPSVLVRGVNWVGDAVMTAPAIRAIKKAHPDSKITLLARPWVAELFEKDPNVGEMVIYDGRYAGMLGKWRLAQMLRQRGCFSKTVLLQNAFDAALIAYLARIPERVGYSRDMRGCLLTKPVSYNGEDRKMHHVDYYLNLLKLAGIGAESPGEPWIYLETSERLEARQALGRLRRPLIGFAPGAVYGSSKRWPPAGFRELASRIIRELGGSVAIFGSRQEAPSADEIMTGSQAGEDIVSLAGKTTLREFASLAAECDALVSNDSGAMHVGYAVGVPVVALFGSTDPALTGPPAGNPVIRKPFSCSPCFERECPRGDTACMRDIEAGEVFEALRGILPIRRAVFFDRDGTLCREVPYLDNWDGFEPFEDLHELKKLKEAGFMLIGVTNQSGVGRGLIKEDFVKEVNEYFVNEHGFDAAYYCPHLPDEFCPCRKPSAGMLFKARRQLRIDLRGSYVVGDRASDMIAAKAAGAKAIFVKTGVENGSEDAVFVAETLTDAVRHIINAEEEDGK